MSKDAPIMNPDAEMSSGQITETQLPLRRISSSDVKGYSLGSSDPAGLNGPNMSPRNTVAIAVDPAALVITECITVTSAMRKHARWAHSSVSAILGGSSSPMNSTFNTSRPSTPRDELGTRKGYKVVRGSSSFGDGLEVEGLANRWGLRGKKGKSIQDNPLIAAFGRLRAELTGCKGKGYFIYWLKLSNL